MKTHISPACNERVNSWTSHAFIEHLVLFVQAIYKRNSYVKTFLQVQHNLRSSHSCEGCNEMYLHMSTKGLKTPPHNVRGTKNSDWVFPARKVYNLKKNPTGK